MKLLLIGLLTFSSLSQAMDVHPKKGQSWILVEKDSSSKYVRFSKCFAKNCEVGIAQRKWISIKKIESQRFNENMQVGGAAFADIILGLFVIGGGAEFGAVVGATTYGTVSASVPYIYAGGTLGGAAGAGAFTFINKKLEAINPIEQYKQADALRDEVILDKDALVESDEDIDLLAERLNLVLSKL